MIIIGEKLNSSIEQVKTAIENRDVRRLSAIAREQANAGAAYLDVNAGMFNNAEGETLSWLAGVALEAGGLPLVFDSPNPVALEYALKNYSGPKPIINSLSLEKARLEPIAQLVKGFNTGIIALCMDDGGIPQTAEGRLEIALKIADALTSRGIDIGDIYFDPMLRPVSVDPEGGKTALKTIYGLRKQLPGAHICCGLSNISFGLPKRKIINRAFLAAAISAGLDSAIMDPTDSRLMAAVFASEALFGQDEYCINYLDRYRSGAFEGID